MSSPPFPAAELFSRFDPAALFKEPWTEFRHRQLGQFINDLMRRSRVPVVLDRTGSSAEGRTLWTLRFGNPRGRRVLTWARQHGDEPDCTAALCMVLDEILSGDPAAASRHLLDRIDFLVFPMVNPDGVARFTRESSMGIDLNRDAVALATPEGQALFGLKDRFQPEFCFNLHDMSPRKARRDGTLVSLAFQAGPYCERDEDNDVRVRAKHVCALMAESVLPWAPENIARYDADYMHRAFGDSMMRWGVSSMLVEAGGWYEPGGDNFVRRLFAVAVMRGLHAIAGREDDHATPHAYDAIPLDSSKRYADVLVSGGLIDAGQGRAPFRADLHVDLLARAERPNAPVAFAGRIVGVGDFEELRCKARVDATGHVVVPGLTVLAPKLELDPAAPDPDVAARFLSAGITTVACGFGPFRKAADRAAFLEETERRRPPLNLVTFEVVRKIEDIRARHGLTELAGFLVRDLVMGANELLRFTHLFHPSATLLPEEDPQRQLIGIDLYFVPSVSPATTHLLLVLRPVESEAGMQRVREEKLRRFAGDFLRHPSQIGLVADGSRDSFPWLPILVHSCATHGIPAPDYLGATLVHAGANSGPATSSVLTMLTRRSAIALNLTDRGAIQRDLRADLALLPAHALDGSDPLGTPSLAPSVVLLDGRVVVNRMDGLARPGEGQWILSGRPRA